MMGISGTVRNVGNFRKVENVSNFENVRNIILHMTKPYHTKYQQIRNNNKSTNLLIWSPLYALESDSGVQTIKKYLNL